MMMEDDSMLTAMQQRAARQEWNRSEVCKDISTGDELDRLLDVFERIGKVFT